MCPDIGYLRTRTKKNIFLETIFSKITSILEAVILYVSVYFSWHNITVCLTHAYFPGIKSHDTIPLVHLNVFFNIESIFPSCTIWIMAFWLCLIYKEHEVLYCIYMEREGFNIKKFPWTDKELLGAAAAHLSNIC